jgi:hypothetical protein
VFNIWQSITAAAYYINVSVFLFVQVGPTYGRKMMTGYLKSKGLVASEVRVGQALEAVHEPYQRARQQVCSF